MLKNEVYDVLKWVAQIALPAVTVFVGAVLGFCSVDGNTIAMVVGIMTAADTLLGTLLGISTYNYRKTEAE